MSGEPADALGFVHRFVKGEDDEAPLLLTLHGTGGDEGDLLPLARSLWPGAPVLSPRGPVVEGDGMPRFFRRVALPPETARSAAYPFTFDEDEIAGRVAELAAFVEVAPLRYGVDGRPVVAIGFSNGANMAAATLLLRPGLLRAAVLFAPMPVLGHPPRPDLSTTAVFLGGGRGDPIATPAGIERLAVQLTDAGAAVEVHLGAGGHQIHLSVVRAAADWLTKTRAALGSGPAALP